MRIHCIVIDQCRLSTTSVMLAQMFTSSTPSSDRNIQPWPTVPHPINQPISCLLQLTRP